jgi:hypothetical protein
LFADILGTYVLREFFSSIMLDEPVPCSLKCISRVSQSIIILDNKSMFRLNVT